MPNDFETSADDAAIEGAPIPEPASAESVTEAAAAASSPETATSEGKGADEPAVGEASDTTPDASDAVEGTNPDLPTMEELDGVSAEIETVEQGLAMLDKKNAPMCDACQELFPEASVDERLALLNCSH